MTNFINILKTEWRNLFHSKVKYDLYIYINWMFLIYIEISLFKYITKLLFIFWNIKWFKRPELTGKEIYNKYFIT